MHEGSNPGEVMHYGHPINVPSSDALLYLNDEGEVDYVDPHYVAPHSPMAPAMLRMTNAQHRQDRAEERRRRSEPAPVKVVDVGEVEPSSRALGWMVLASLLFYAVVGYVLWRGVGAEALSCVSVPMLRRLPTMTQCHPCGAYGAITTTETDPCGAPRCLPCLVVGYAESCHEATVEGAESWEWEAMNADYLLAGLPHTMLAHEA